MLGVERIHVMMKKLAKSTKNIMFSLRKNNDRLIRSQLQWRFNSTHDWATKARPSSFLCKQVVPDADGVVKPRGALHKTKVDQTIFSHLQTEWTIKNKAYRKFRQKYDTYLRNHKKDKKKGRNKRPAVPFSRWQHDRKEPNSPEQKKWQKMDNTAWTCTMATIDEQLFRTRGHEKRKRCKTTNKYIIGVVNVTQPNGKTKTKKCYGVIKKFYVHFMYPPARTTYKLTIKKLETFEEPWIMCALCEWYEELGSNPVTGLTQIRPNPFWEAGCPITNLANCLPINPTFWPVNPFNPSHFGEDGEILDKDCSVYDFSGDGTYEVITHHEDINLNL